MTNEENEKIFNKVKLIELLFCTSDYELIIDSICIFIAESIICSDCFKDENIKKIDNCDTLNYKCEYILDVIKHYSKQFDKKKND